MDKDLFVIVGMIDEIYSLSSSLQNELNRTPSELDINYDKLYEIAYEVEEISNSLLSELED